MTIHRAGHAALLEIAALRFAYPGEPELFTGWSARVEPGVTLLRGDIGSGKTTLLRLIAGALHGGGHIVLNGHRLDADAAARRRDVCWIDAGDEAFDAMTAGALMSDRRQGHPTFDEAAWRRHVEAFGLGPHLAKPLHQLSTGSRRKAGLAVALSAGVPVTLLDEPAAGLDAASIRALVAALADANVERSRVVLVVSSFGLEALADCSSLTL